MRKTMLNVRVEPELRDALERAAEAEKTSAAELIRRGLRSIVAARGVALDHAVEARQ